MPAEEKQSRTGACVEHFNDPETRNGYFVLYEPAAMSHGYPGVEPGLESIRRWK